MSNKIKRIGILTSGGDAPGMNAAIRAVVRTANYDGIEVYGIRRGFNGLINNDIILLNSSSVAHLINRGGTFLYTARSDEFRTKEGRKKAYETYKKLELDGLVAIGGDGTFSGCLEFSSEFPVKVVGIPATIDNDISCTHYSIGYDTAANTAVEAIDKVRDTMQSHERCSVIEVMGHRSGKLAMYVGIATGATAVLIPEKKWDFEKDVAMKIKSAQENGMNHFMIVVAEGAKKDESGKFDNKVVGNGLASQQVASLIKENLNLDPRIVVLGHVQRGGTPTARDRVTATRMGYNAVKALESGENNRVIVHINGEVTNIDMEEGLSAKYSINKNEENVLKTMTGITA